MLKSVQRSTFYVCASTACVRAPAALQRELRAARAELHTLRLTTASAALDTALLPPRPDTGLDIDLGGADSLLAPPGSSLGDMSLGLLGATSLRGLGSDKGGTGSLGALGEAAALERALQGVSLDESASMRGTHLSPGMAWQVMAAGHGVRVGSGGVGVVASGADSAAAAARAAAAELERVSASVAVPARRPYTPPEHRSPPASPRALRPAAGFVPLGTHVRPAGAGTSPGRLGARPTSDAAARLNGEIASGLSRLAALKAGSPPTSPAATNRINGTAQDVHAVRDAGKPYLGLSYSAASSPVAHSQPRYATAATAAPATAPRLASGVGVRGGMSPAAQKYLARYREEVLGDAYGATAATAHHTTATYTTAAMAPSGGAASTREQIAARIGAAMRRLEPSLSGATGMQ